MGPNDSNIINHYIKRVLITGTYNLQQTTFFPVSWEDGATVTGAGAGVMIGAGF